MENARPDLAEKDMDLRTASDTIRDRGKCKNLIVGEHLTEERKEEERRHLTITAQFMYCTMYMYLTLCCIYYLTVRCIVVFKCMVH